MVNADLLLHIQRQSTLRQLLSSFAPNASSRITTRRIMSVMIWYTQIFGGFLKEGDAHGTQTPASAVGGPVNAAYNPIQTHVHRVKI